MRTYKLDKPLVESKLPAKDTRVYYVDVDEVTNTLANVMEFVNNEWRVKFLVDDVDIFSRSIERLEIPDGKIKLNPKGIVAEWLSGNQYESDVRDAADTAGLSYVIGELSNLIQAVNDSIPTIEDARDACTTAGDTETAAALNGVAEALSEEIARFNDDEDLIDNLEDLADVIYSDGETIDDGELNKPNVPEGTEPTSPIIP